MNDRVKDLQQRIKAEGMQFQKDTDVSRTWWNRGHPQWRQWVLERDEKEKKCSAPTAANEPA